MNVQDAFRRLCEVISDSMRKLGIPGVAVGMISGDLEFRGLWCDQRRSSVAGRRRDTFSNRIDDQDLHWHGRNAPGRNGQARSRRTR